MHDTVIDPAEIAAAGAPGKPPARSKLVSEWTVATQPFRLLGRAPTLRQAPRGNGRLTVDVPGWLTGSEVLSPLRRYLASLGHNTQAWGLGRNGSGVEETVERFQVRLEQLVDAHGGEPANLVGWSLGGVIARETARERPDLVARIATFGTPAQGGPSFTAGASVFGDEECARIAALQDEANRERPLPMPVTAIFTKRDGVVDWRACLDPWALDIRHIEVRSSHVGLGVDPDVWWAVANALAEEH